MRKSFIKKVFKTAVVAVTLSFAWGLGGCSNSIDVFDASTSDSSNSQLAVLEGKKEELALYAMNGQFIASESELEGSVRAFISNSDSNSSSSRSLMSSSEISKVKMDSIAIATTSANSARTVVEDFSEEIPIYYYEITIGDRTDVVIATPDRRVGNILAYIEDCSVENLADDADSPVSVFFDNLSGYVQAIADLWNNELTDSYLESVRSAAESVVKSGEYTYSDWVYNGGNEKCVIHRNIAKYINQTKFQDLISENLKLKYNGCGPTAIMHLLCYHQFPKTISVDAIDSNGLNYKGIDIWSNFSVQNFPSSTQKNSTSADIGEKYYYKGYYEAFSEEQDFVSNNSDISVSDLKTRFNALEQQSSLSLESADAKFNQNENSFLDFTEMKELEGRYQAYHRLKKKSYSSLDNAKKYLSDNVKKSKKTFSEYKNVTENCLYKNLCFLFYQTVVGCKAYPCYDSNNNQNGTGAYLNDCISYLKSVGYSMNDATQYSYSNIKSSIDNNRPALILGQTGTYTKSDGSTGSDGHYWIIDGYANLSCTAECKTTKSDVKITADYVHCTWGWYGMKNGYYLSNVFDSQYYPLYTNSKDVYSTRRSATGNKDGYFQHDLRLITEIHPNI